jgi:hypothetical protein
MLQGPSHSDVLTKVVDALSIVEVWCKRHKLEISKDNTSLMPMFIRNIDIYINQPKLKLWGLKAVTEIKYLGTMLDCKMDWFPHTQYLENKLLHIWNNLARSSKTSWGLSYSNLVTIRVYKYAILPAITYAARVWYCFISKRAKNKLQQIQRSYLIFLTKA